MLWLAGKLCRTNEQRKTLVLAACGCARLALPYVAKNEKRPLHAIEIAKQWARGEDEITLDQVQSAASAATHAAYAASAAYAAAYAASAAASAASAAYAASAAASAAYAASVAHGSAYAAYNGKIKEILKSCADIVRAYYPTAPKL